MDAYRHLLLSRGRYRLLALTHRPQYAADAVFGYTVATLAGDRVRDEATLEMAQAWIDRRIAHERASQAIAVSKPIRRR